MCKQVNVILTYAARFIDYLLDELLQPQPLSESGGSHLTLREKMTEQQQSEVGQSRTASCTHLQITDWNSAWYFNLGSVIL